MLYEVITAVMTGAGVRSWAGKRLFPAGMRINLELVASKALPTGIVFQQYRPVV